MKVDVERFIKQLDGLTEHAYTLGWKEKAFTKSVTDRIAQTWFNKQMADNQAAMMESMGQHDNAAPTLDAHRDDGA